MTFVRKMGEVKSPPAGVIADRIAFRLSVDSFVIDILAIENDRSLHNVSVSAEEDKDVSEKMEKPSTYNAEKKGGHRNEARK